MYQRGQIYCIRSYQTDSVYIGSTCNLLYKRMGSHRKDYRRYLNDNFNYITSFEILKYDDAFIELVEDYPCENKKQLERREGEVIRATENCVNKLIAGRSYKEWYQDNREKIKEYREDTKERRLEYQKEYYQDNREKIKQYREDTKDRMAEYNKEYYQDNREKILEQIKNYYQDNREKILEQKKEKVTCECGSIVGKSNIKRHEQTKKHQTYLENL